MKLRGVHVKSHQTTNGQVPLEVRLNEECDRLAKERVFNNDFRIRSKPTAYAAPSAKVSVYLKGSLITNNVRERFIEAGQRNNLTEYLRERNEWSMETLEAVDWDLFSIAIEKVYQSSKSRFSRIIKFNHNLQNTGRQKRLFTTGNTSEPVASDRCPLCNGHEETTMHLYSCSDPTLRDIIEKGTHEIEEALRNRHLPPQMWKAIARGIWTVQSGNDPAGWEPNNLQIAEAYRDQTFIGWHNFLKGRLSRKWGTILQH